MTGAALTGAALTGERWRRDADVAVIGSGAAGISAALTAAASGASVLLVTKDLTGGASPLAQGGLAAAIGPGDTAAAHARDTEVAGAGLCEPDIVAALAAGSPGAVEWLAGRGAELERRRLRLEGGHSAHRVVHSGGDATGAEVHRALLEALLTSRIEILDRTVALDLVAGDAVLQGGDVLCGGDGDSDGVTGLTAAIIGPGGELDPGLITARAVILAAGGLGQAYATTTNPPGATGDAMAIAARAGAVLRDPEFVQFHPTVLWRDGATGQCPLITEALRGAGAVLRDLDGKPVMAGHDPRGDLAPRDVVSARVHEVITFSGGPGHVWLDATALGAGLLENGFPTVTAACRKHDIDPVTDLIPVAPGAHYSCGGIRAGLDGRTSVPGLYAVGEAASTGVHGANRLASNSLVEAVIAGRRVGGTAASHEISGVRSEGGATEGGAAGNVPAPGAELVPPAARPVLASAMSRYAGVLRDAEGLTRLAAIIEGASGASGSTGASGSLGSPSASGTYGSSGVSGAPGNPGHPGGPAVPLSLASVEAANLRTVSALIAAAALRRAESRGCHRRSDAPETEPAPRHTLARLDCAPSGDSGRIHLDWEDL